MGSRLYISNVKITSPASVLRLPRALVMNDVPSLAMTDLFPVFLVQRLSGNISSETMRAFIVLEATVYTCNIVKSNQMVLLTTKTMYVHLGGKLVCVSEKQCLQLNSAFFL